MFQYACGRALSLRNRCPIQLDTRHYSKNKNFCYGLGNLRIKATIGTSESLPPEKNHVLKYYLWKRFSRSQKLLCEQGLGFDPRIALEKANVYLKGYWQSEKYFSDEADVIRRELSVSLPPTGKNAEFFRKIQETPSIAIHVRRGDYVSNPKALAFHGTCPPNYYLSAVEHIIKETNRDYIAYIFSDDCTWARKNIKLPCNTVIVDHNKSDSAHEDLRLMAACQHQVISNSTFSWWAGWLNTSSEKVVVAPDRWFADPQANDRDIIPSSWHRLAMSSSKIRYQAA